MAAAADDSEQSSVSSESNSGGVVDSTTVPGISMVEVVERNGSSGIIKNITNI